MSRKFQGEFSCKLTRPGGTSIAPDGGNLRQEEDDEGDPRWVGTFSGLTPGEKYELLDTGGKQSDAGSLSKSMAQVETPEYKAARIARQQDDAAAAAKAEGCSCIYGNPCQIKDNCHVWERRTQVASAVKEGKAAPSKLAAHGSNIVALEAELKKIGISLPGRSA